MFIQTLEKISYPSNTRNLTVISHEIEKKGRNIFLASRLQLLLLPASVFCHVKLLKNDTSALPATFSACRQYPVGWHEGRTIQTDVLFICKQIFWKHFLVKISTTTMSSFQPQYISVIPSLGALLPQASKKCQKLHAVITIDHCIELHGSELPTYSYMVLHGFFCPT